MSAKGQRRGKREQAEWRIERTDGKWYFTMAAYFDVRASGELVFFTPDDRVSLLYARGTWVGIERGWDS